MLLTERLTAIETLFSLSNLSQVLLSRMLARLQLCQSDNRELVLLARSLSPSAFFSVGVGERERGREEAVRSIINRKIMKASIPALLPPIFCVFQTPEMRGEKRKQWTQQQKLKL